MTAPQTDPAATLWWLELTAVPTMWQLPATGKKTAEKSKIWFFEKVYNYTHLTLIRYSVDIPLDKTVINEDVFRDPALKHKAWGEAEVKSEERYKPSKNEWVCFSH